MNFAEKFEHRLWNSRLAGLCVFYRLISSHKSKEGEGEEQAASATVERVQDSGRMEQKHSIWKQRLRSWRKKRSSIAGRSDTVAWAQSSGAAVGGAAGAAGALSMTSHATSIESSRRCSRLCMDRLGIVTVGDPRRAAAAALVLVPVVTMQFEV